MSNPRRENELGNLKRWAQPFLVHRYAWNAMVLVTGVVALLAGAVRGAVDGVKEHADQWWTA